MELNKIEKEKKAKYSTTDLFANTNAVKRSIEDSKDNVTENYIIEHPKDSVADNHIEDNNSKSKQLVKYDNQKWYVRLFKKILGFFKRNWKIAKNMIKYLVKLTKRRSLCLDFH